MHQVMGGGIGGVNCGGRENDVVIGRAQDLAIMEAKVYQYLTYSADRAQEYAKQGMLTMIGTVKYDKNGRKYTHRKYKVTPLGFATYSGKSCLDQKKGE